MLHNAYLSHLFSLFYGTEVVLRYLRQKIQSKISSKNSLQFMRRFKIHDDRAKISAFDVDIEVLDCSLDEHKNCTQINISTDLDLDLRSVSSLAQSVLEYATKVVVFKSLSQDYFMASGFN